MTTRDNVWLLRDESASQPHGAVRADTITGITTLPRTHDLHELLITVDGESVDIGSCATGHRDQMANALLTVLAGAGRSDADFIVVEAVPPAQQDGLDFWRVHENAWPGARQPAGSGAG